MTLERNPLWFYYYVSPQKYRNVSANFPLYCSTIKFKSLSYRIIWQIKNTKTQKYMTQEIFRYMQAENTRLKIIKYIHIRSVFKTQSSIYDGAFLQKQSTVFSRSLFSRKISIVDVWLGSKYASAYVWIKFPI